MFYFEVLGPPIPKGRPVVTRGGQRTFTPKRTLEYEERVRQAALEAGAGALNFERDINIQIECYMPNRRLADVDNLAKSIMDGLVGACYSSDHLVTALSIIRHIDAEKPRACVWVYGLRDSPEDQAKKAKVKKKNKAQNKESKYQLRANTVPKPTP